MRSQSGMAARLSINALLMLGLIGCGTAAPSPTFPPVAPAMATEFAGRQLTASDLAATLAAVQTKAVVDLTAAAPSPTPTPCIKERYNQPEADGAVNHIVVMCDGAFRATPVATAPKQQLAPALPAPTSTPRPANTATNTPRPAPTATATTSSVDHSGVPGSGFACPTG